MLAASLHRSVRPVGALAALRRVLPASAAQRLLQPPRALTHLDPRVRRVCYSTTSALFRKYEIHQDHVNVHTSSSSLAADDQGQEPLSDHDDLIIGNEGIETIDPKDFPELYPGEDEVIEGLNQESHPDNESDFETDGQRTESVLLSDKQRSEEEFSWFVDESFPERATGTGDQQQQKDSASSSLSDDFVPLWQKNIQRSPGDATESGAHGHEDTAVHSADSIASLVKLIESERAKNVKVIDMREKCDWTDYMIVAEGLSERHLGNVADEVYSALKKSSPTSSPPVMEGRDTSDWVVIDAGSVVIHFMTPEARKERDLEGLWASVQNPLKLKDVENISWDDVKGKMTKSWKENTGRSKGEDGKRGRRGEQDIPLSEVVKW
ncbi:hypothetical protein BGZ99_000058 [Dissophora globulifera]|uniref:Uncharacterized protein n=1 Tax=Dissophora globulifera TaxID=979702 RepID=A0A9P6RYL3_9FUNG|nr:hypothetical protein BGZ99_000058 [Dissophora globulifera]